MTTPFPPDSRRIERQWQHALAASPACLPLERLGEPLTAADARHVAGCARCQTERELFAAYDADAASEGDAQSVEWITAQTKRRLADVRTGPAAAPSPAARRSRGVPSWALMAASLAIVVTGAALLVRSGDGPVPAATTDVYRSSRVEITSPVGDVSAVPAELVWAPVPQAVRYEIRLSEVDGTELWRIDATSPAVSVPAEIRAFALPAKTLVWQVTAKGAGDVTLAESGAIGFRLRITPAEAER